MVKKWLTFSRFTALFRFFALAAGVMAVGACTYRGGIDQPVTLKATWFSYLDGDDIRAACGQPGVTWYRLVYNGNYDEQLRSYEVVAEGPGPANYVARVINGGGLDLTRLSLRDLQAPGRWTTHRERLDEAERARLERALERSGAFAPAPEGLRLASEEFYWTFAGCRDGAFSFNAWRYPSPGFAQLAFPEVLLAHDRTGLAVNPPRKIAPIEKGRRGPGPEEDTTPRFDLKVGKNGLANTYALF